MLSNSIWFAVFRHLPYSPKSHRRDSNTDRTRITDSPGSMSPSVHSSEERPRSRITSHTSRPQSSRNGNYMALLPAGLLCENVECKSLWKGNNFPPGRKKFFNFLPFRCKFRYDFVSFPHFLFSWLSDPSRIRCHTIARVPRGSRGRNQEIKRTSAHRRIWELFSQHEAGSAAVGGGASFGGNWNANMRRIVRRVRLEPGERARGHGKESREYHITLWRRNAQTFSLSLRTLCDIDK